MSSYIINLEEGMPSVENARMKLDQALRTAKARQYKSMKVIHGYGSSGKGGAIKKDVGLFLTGKKREKAIRGYVKGENFTPFYPEARDIIAKCPELARDSDYPRGNDGITIILL